MAKLSFTKNKFPRLPLWSELPNFDLHLDQLLDITNSFVEPLIEEKITKTMMHNYFKAGIIEAPIKKKYERKQLAGAIVIGVLKNVFSLSEIEQGLCLILADTSPAVGYDNFIKMFNEQSSQKAIKNPPMTSINLETTSGTTLVQYSAVQSVLFWFLARRIIQKNQVSMEK
ncbi:DUF1836 domain-containing protein [Pediococcus ethanolidurans]|uniref:DUF1836 domain-containing protein n=1 Tax=Pediococcus ethanolidurans TaxID=319653 RepID=UPI0029557798|nr:DUF1836 domain-containing protein [Pediococcus ethanolidurans]